MFSALKVTLSHREWHQLNIYSYNRYCSQFSIKIHNTKWYNIWITNVHRSPQLWDIWAYIGLKFFQTTYPLKGRRGLNPIPPSWATAWTDDQSITWIKTHSHTPMDNVVSPICLYAGCFWMVKPKHPEKTHADTGRTCKSTTTGIRIRDLLAVRQCNLLSHCGVWSKFYYY